MKAIVCLFLFNAAALWLLLVPGSNGAGWSFWSSSVIAIAVIGFTLAMVVPKLKLLFRRERTAPDPSQSGN